jgi:hypothetical protein
MSPKKLSQNAWVPASGSWEEAVFSWNEQIERAFRGVRSAPTEQTPLREESPGTTRTSG